MKNTFKIGDKVQVINSGKRYSTYAEWAKKYNLKLYKLGSRLLDGDIGEVVAIGKHTSQQNQIVLGILIDNEHFIISVEGVELYKKHKHHDVLIAIAEGKEIEYYSSTFGWLDCDPQFNQDPLNYPNGEYRIKPETKPDFSLYAEVLTTDGKFGHAKFFGNVLTQEDNVKFTFDGKTKKLKAVELIK
jgi:hypothetical protein